MSVVQVISGLIKMMQEMNNMIEKEQQLIEDLNKLTQKIVSKSSQLKTNINQVKDRFQLKLEPDLSKQNTTKKEQQFNENFKVQQRQKQKIVFKETQFKTKINVKKDRIQLKLELLNLNKNQQSTKQQTNKNSLEQIKQYLQNKSNIWQQLDDINKKDPTGQLTQMIYEQILNQVPSKQKIQEHIAIVQKIEQKSKNSQDSIQTAMLCISGYLQSVSNQINVIFSQKSTLQSKISTKLLSTGFNMLKYKCQQKIQDGQTQWSYQKIAQNPKQLQRFQQWYKLRLKTQYCIKDQNIRITGIIKGSIRVVWETCNPSQISANPAAAKKIQVHPYFKQYQLCAQDFDARGNIQFDSSKNDVQFRGNWPYYQPINCKRYGIKVWDLYDGGNNAWLTMNNEPGEWVVAYHGVDYPDSNSSYNGKKVLNSIMDGKNQGQMFIPGGGQVYKDGYSVNKNQLVGQGVYCSPHLKQSLDYSNGSVLVNGTNYHLIFQCRVNPKKVHVTSYQPYWVLNDPKDIRPYGIILMKSPVYSSYPSALQQFNQTFTYQKYKDRIDKTQF